MALAQMGNMTSTLQGEHRSLADLHIASPPRATSTHFRVGGCFVYLIGEDEYCNPRIVGNASASPHQTALP